MLSYKLPSLDLGYLSHPPPFLELYLPDMDMLAIQYRVQLPLWQKPERKSGRNPVLEATD